MRELVKRLKYKIINPFDEKVVHHSFNKRNAERWIREFDDKQMFKIKKLKRF